MKRDLLLYNRALFLRRKKGYSYNEIRVEVPVAKSTLSLWLRNVELSDEQVRQIKLRQFDKARKKWGVSSMGEWNRKKRQIQVSAIRGSAREEVASLSQSEFFVAGVMLYWAEGDKGGRAVRVSNSDAVFVKFMMRWLRECCRIPEENFRASIHYHRNQDEFAIKKYWSAITGIPLDHFYKSFCKPPGTGHRKHVLQHGTMQIRVLKSADLFHRICGWHEGLINDVISGKQMTYNISARSSIGGADPS